MQIMLYDGTSRWRGYLPQTVNDWNAALASVGRDIYLTYQAIAVAPPEYRVQGGIVCSDSLAMNPSLPRQAEGDCSLVQGIWNTAYIHFFWDPADPRSADPIHALAVPAHEVGHCLMLKHPEDMGFPGFTDTVMTDYAMLPKPTQWDALHCMPGYPIPTAPNPHKKRRKKKH